MPSHGLGRFDTDCRYRRHGVFNPPFDELNSIVNDLLLASRRMARFMTRRERSFRNDADLEKHNREMGKVHAVFYSGEEDDPITPRLESVVGQIELACKAIIDSRGTLFSLLNKRL